MYINKLQDKFRVSQAYPYGPIHQIELDSPANVCSVCDAISSRDNYH